MAATAFESRVLEVHIHCVLLMHDGGHRLEGHAKIDGLAIGDPALDAARPVGDRAHPAATHAKGVVVLTARQEDPAEARPDVESLRGRQAEHGFGQIGLEPVEDGFAPAWGYT